MKLSRGKIALYLCGTFLGVTLLLSLALFLVAKYHLDRMEKSALDDSVPVQALDAVSQDLAKLDGVKALAEAAQVESLIDPAHDAGSILNAALPWQRGQSQPSAMLELPLGVRELLDSWGGMWPTNILGAPLQGVEFGWMSRLLSFSYWQLEEPQARDTVGMSDPVLAQGTDPTYEALPDLGLLSTWIKLRLASVIQHPSADQRALHEIQHLAGLAFTSQRMSVIQAGITWHELVRDAEDYARGIGVTLNLPPGFMTRSEMSLARRAIPAQMAYLDLAVKPEVAERIFPRDKRHLGMCAALRQRLPALQWEETLLGSTYPEAFQGLNLVVERLAGQCRPAPESAGLLNQDRVPPLLLTKGGVLDRWFLKVPYLRKIFGLTLLGLVRPRDLEPYGVMARQI
jgi:hypothetical protein